MKLYGCQGCGGAGTTKLLSGSIADNICFFDESFELEHMMHCTELAGIHEEICHMPMAYNA
jgi:ATP-binding cassette subfamily B protein RaxB